MNLFSKCLAVFAKWYLVVKSHKFAVLLPKNFLYKFIFFIVPGSEIVIYKSACIARIGIEAPECVVDTLFLDKLSQIGHPLEVGLGHIAAPLAYKQWRCALFIYIEPVVVPSVIVKRFICIIALEPLLLIDRRAVIVRGIHKLVPVFSKVNRVVLYASEIAAPPGGVVIFGICGAEIAV